MKSLYIIKKKPSKKLLYFVCISIIQSVIIYCTALNWNLKAFSAFIAFSSLIFAFATGSYKIGITNNEKRRLIEIQNGSSCKLFYCYVSKSHKAARDIEQRLHKKFKKKRQQGEWFFLNVIDLAFLFTYLFFKLRK